MSCLAICLLCVAAYSTAERLLIRAVGTINKMAMYQNLKMGLLPSAFSLMWGSAFGATAMMLFMALLMTLS